MIAHMIMIITQQLFTIEYVAHVCVMLLLQHTHYYRYLCIIILCIILPVLCRLYPVH